MLVLLTQKSNVDMRIVLNTLILLKPYWYLNQTLNSACGK